MNISFRRDIHSLRGYAILIVILNHFLPDLFPNAFVGVDIFFVISGFVVSLSIFKQIKTEGQFNASAFLVRRIFRLAPALWVYITLTFILFSLVISSKYIVEYFAFTRTGLLSVVGLANIYLLKQSTDYFASSSLLNPYAHTWSLSIEQQFYIIIAIALFLSFRFTSNAVNKKYFLLALIGALLASYSFFLYSNTTDQSTAYYSTFARIWELCLGVLTFVICYFQWVGPSLRFYVLTIIRLSALVVILTASFYSGLPRHIAIQLSVAGTSLFIISGNLYYLHSNFIRGERSLYCRLTDRLLTTQFLQYFGTVSYSLYLWHWGVLSFFSWTITLDSINNIALAFLISLFLSHISCFLLEIPFVKLSRSWQRPSRSYIAFLASPFMAVLLIPFGIPWFSNLFFLGKSESKSNGVSCNTYLPRDLPKLQQTRQTPSTLNIKFLIIGDSHAGSFDYSAIKSCYFNNNSLSVIAKAGTPFPPLYYKYSLHSRSLYDSLRESEAISNRFHAFVNSLSPSGFRSPHEAFSSESTTSRLNVILINRLPLYFSPSRQGLDNPQKIQAFSPGQYQPQSQDVSFEQWIASVKSLAKRNPHITFTIFQPIPFFPDLYPEFLCTKQPYRPSLAKSCYQSLSKASADKSVSNISQLLNSLGSQLPNLLVYDPSSSICHGTSANITCHSHLYEESLYRDTSHLNQRGAMLVLHDYFKWYVSKSSNAYLMRRLTLAK